MRPETSILAHALACGGDVHFRITFNNCVEMDRRIGALLNRARMLPKPPPWTQVRANAVWYGKGGMRSELKELVGYGRPGGPPELRTGQAYDVTYRTIYAALLNPGTGSLLRD